jgi:hypothetical protein
MMIRTPEIADLARSVLLEFLHWLLRTRTRRDPEAQII